MPPISEICCPITAIDFVRVQSKSLLLAGQGPLLRAYDHGTRRLLCSKRVFNTQAVHGITSHQLSEHSTETLLLIWGCRSVCVVQIRIGDDENSQDDFHLTFQDVIAETETGDWVLDACITSSRVDDSRSDCSIIEAVLATAHNVVLYLHALLDFSSNSATCASIYRLAAGPRSILYSAHIIWQDSNTSGLVAAGTVYGEILYWSFRTDDATRFGHSRKSGSGVLHHTFEGHEGSVFGVRISEEVTDEHSGLPKRILASCSDDRTIRIWDISSHLNGDSGENSTKRLIRPSVGGNNAGDIHQRSSPSIAIAMGHASRIWGLRFLFEANSNRYLLSFGEDTTTQVWRLFRQPNAAGHQSSLSATTSLVLQNCAKHKFHSGKNIWACAIYKESVSSKLVCTGGADGRIVCFNVHDPNVSPYGDGISSQWTFKESLEDMNKACNPSELKAVKIATPHLPSNIFIALEGRWKIVRNLDSAAPTYPSGSFKGTAVFEKRPPTNPKYEAEYLYLEDGILTTQQGLSLTATRRYVYRLQKDTHAISSWFVKPDEGSTVHYLFHELNFPETDDHQSKIRNTGNLVANGHHLCINDDYRVAYGFQAREGTLPGWSLRYTVKGPKKDYIADAEYARDDWPSECKAELNSNQSIGRNSAEAILIKKTKNPETSSKTDCFKAYTWINENVFLATTDLGWLLAGTLRDAKDQSGLNGVDSSNSVSWEKIAKVDNLNGPCIATSICSHETAIFAASGTIHIFLHGDKSIHSPIKVPGKISYMAAHLISRYPCPQSHTFEIGIVIACLGSSTISLCFVDVDKKRSKCSVRQYVNFSQSPSFVVTSSCLIDSRAVLILGSRNGSLAIYQFTLLAITILPAARIDDIHDKDAITSIENLPPTSSPEAEHDTIYFLTAGRNGTYAIHQIHLDSNSSYGSIKFHTVHIATTPIGNIIEGSHFSSLTNHLFLWGFRSKHFVLWNESLKQEIMLSGCGGAPRNWAFFLPQQEDKTGGNLVWTKASRCHVHAQRGGSHIVLQEGGHGREIKALAVSPGIIITTARIKGSRSRSSSSDRNTKQSSAESLSQATKRYLATGAEDTEIRIFDISSTSSFPWTRYADDMFKCTNIMSKHTTGLQALRWSRDSKYLFSAAGCDEFFVWRITPLPLEEELGLQLGVVCEAIAPTSEQRDLRVMDFDVKEDFFAPSDDDKKEGNGKGYAISMAFSDSSVRIYNYNPKSQTFHLRFRGNYTTHCLTQALHLHNTNNSLNHLLLTASTDGHVALWPFFPNPPHPDNNNIISYKSRIPIHQSGIKSVSCISLPESAKLVVTGGDDGGLGILFLASSCFDPEFQFKDDGVEEEPTKSEEEDEEEEEEVLLIPAAHAAAITAVIYLRSSPPFSSSSSSSSASPYHFFATISTDQRVKIWRIRTRHGDSPPRAADDERSAKRIVIDVEKVNEMDSLICDASSAAVVDYCHYKLPPPQDEDDDEEEEENGEGQRLGEEEYIALVVTGIGTEIFFPFSLKS